jgi:hypothetical protein
MTVDLLLRWPTKRGVRSAPPIRSRQLGISCGAQQVVDDVTLNGDVQRLSSIILNDGKRLNICEAVLEFKSSS